MYVTRLAPIFYFALLAVLVGGCASKEYAAWLEEVKSAREQWHSCALDATAKFSKQYSDPDMVARYALHLCEQRKEEFIAAHLRNRATIQDKFSDFVEKDETRLRERMQMFATKWMADQDAKLDQAFPLPMEFMEPSLDSKAKTK